MSTPCKLVIFVHLEHDLGWLDAETLVPYMWF